MSVVDIDWQGSELGRYASLTESASSHDEVIGPDGVRDEQQIVAAAVDGLGAPGLLAARAEAARLVRDDGVHYGGDIQSRRWVVDPIPLVLGAAEWSTLERGLTQRAHLLDAVLRDLYGDRSLISAGVLPAEVVFGHDEFLHQAVGVTMTGQHQLVMTGSDLARGSDGEWFVLSDRTGVPSGAGYAMVTRRITSRVMTDLHRSTRLQRLRGFFETMRRTLQGLAPDGGRQAKMALLWPGSASETAYEMGFLATLLGLSLVEGDDLVTRDGDVYLDAPDGRTRIDVLLRRVDSAFCDPLEWRPDSQLGLPGLLEAARRSRLSVANPLGSGVLENPALFGFLPQISRHLLGEDLLLHGTDSYWCGDASSRSHVETHLADLVIKPISRGASSTGTGTVLGWMLSDDERDDLRRRIGHEPWAWVGQDPMLTSTAPVVTANGLEPRRLVLRTFGVADGDGYSHLPGGLARMAPESDAFVISNMAGALAKDVWVLDDSATVAESMRTDTRDLALWAEGADARPLTPRVADNLFWFGRHAERADATARLVRLAINLSDDHAARTEGPGRATLDEIARALTALNGLVVDDGDDPVAARAHLRALATDADFEGSLAFALRHLELNAHEVPTVMSSDVWHVLATCNRVLDDMTGQPADFQAGLLAVQQATMALFGIVGESFVRDQTWAFIDAGVRLERAVNTLALIGVAFTDQQTLLVADRVADVVLEACDSLITHRRRSASGVGPVVPVNSAAALLVLDELNPRSVVHQLDRLALDLGRLGDVAASERVAGLRDHLSLVDSSVLLHGDVTPVWTICLDTAQALREVAADLAQRHFTRQVPRRSTSTAWLTPVSPRLEGRL